MSIKDASTALRDAVAGVAGVRAYSDPGATLDPPAAIVGPPVLQWRAFSTEPTDAAFIVYVVVSADDRALERLWDLIPAVADALDAVPDATVIRADPGVYPSGGADLPSYEIQVEVSL